MSRQPVGEGRLSDATLATASDPLRTLTDCETVCPMTTLVAHPDQPREEAADRRVGGWLAVGLFMFPWATVWLTYRHGYTVRARVISTLWFSLWLWAKSCGGPTLDAYFHSHPWW